MIERIMSGLWNFIFPLSCIGCIRNGSALCTECLSEISLADTSVDKNIYPVFNYKHPMIKQALWELKFKNNKAVAQPLAQALYDKILEEMQELEIFQGFTSPLIIPIPLSKKREKERGYNQSEILCKKLSFIDPMSFKLYTNVLYKPFDTKQQTKTRSRSERKNNLRGCFAVKHQEKIKGRNIILIDDIVTTGATISEARKVLKRFGARKIVAFTVAH